MYKKACCTCKIVVFLIKPIAFVASPLPSPSLDLKVPSGGNSFSNVRRFIILRSRAEGLNSFTKNGKMNLSRVSIFSEYARKLKVKSRTRSRPRC